MTVRNFYQPTEPTDWTKKLKEIYAIQTEQYNEHHQNLLEQSRQKEAAHPGVTNLKLFKSILATTETGLKLYNQFKPSEEDKKKELQNTWNEKTVDERRAIKTSYEINKREIQKDDAEFLKELKNRYSINNEQAEKLVENALALSGSETVKLAEFAAAEDVSLLTKDQYINQLSIEDRDAYDAADPFDQAAGERKWILDTLNNRYADGVVNTVLNEVNRKNKTQVVSQRNLSQVTARTKEDQAFEARFITTSEIKEPDDLANDVAAWIRLKSYKYSKLSDGTTPTQQATNEFFNRLIKLGESQRLTRDQFNKLMSGKLVDHDGGDTISKAFLDKFKAKETAVLDAITRGQNLKGDALAALGEVEYATALSNAAAVNSDGTRKMTVDQFDAAMTKLSAFPLKNHDSKIETLERIFHSNQTKDATAAILADHQYEITHGKLDLAAIEKIDNVAAKRQLEKLYAKQVEAENRGHVKERMSSIEREVLGGRGGPNREQGLTGPASDVNIDLQNFYRIRYFDLVSKAGENPDYALIAAQATKDLDTYKISNGWGIIVGEKGAGKFSVDVLDTGEYSNYRKENNIRLNPAYKDQESKWSQTNGVAWENGYQARLRIHGSETGDNGVPLRYSKVGGIFSDAQLAYFAKTKTISAEMRYIAARENESISRLLGYAINAKVDSDDKEFSQLYNLAQISTAQNSDEIILEKSYNKLALKTTAQKEAAARGESVLDLETLTARAKRNGFDSLTGNQVQRLLVHLGETNQPSAEMADFADTKDRESRLSSLGSNYTLDERILSLRAQGKSDSEIKEILRKNPQ